MAEKTLNEALSGGEIREIISQEIEKRMKGDCTLSDDLSYAGFIAKFDIKIQYLRSLTKETLVWGAINQIPEQETESVGQTAISDSHQSASSPDIERQQHDLPIPVMVQTPSGSMRQKVRIERPRK